MQEEPIIKCIKNKSSGIVTRVSNDTAKELVASGSYTFSSKSAFKRVMRSPMGKAVRQAFNRAGPKIIKTLNENKENA